MPPHAPLRHDLLCPITPVPWCPRSEPLAQQLHATGVPLFPDGASCCGGSAMLGARRMYHVRGRRTTARGKPWAHRSPAHHTIHASSLAKLTSNCAMWPLLQDAILKRLTFAYMAICRTALTLLEASNESEPMNSTSILAAVDRVPPAVYLILTRLRYTPSLLARASPPLLATLDARLEASTGWPALVLDDFAWLNEQLQDHRGDSG